MMAKSLRRRLRQMNRAKILSAEERAQLILDERTERLASRAIGETPAIVDTIEVLVCGVGSERYGIPLPAVAQIMPDQTCVPVLDAPPALVGILGRNNHLISVIDLGRALGSSSMSQDEPSSGGSRHLVLLRRERPRIALRVDRAYGVFAVVPLTSDRARNARNEAVIGYAEAASSFADQERVLSLVDVERLLHPFLPSSAPGV